MSDRGPVNEALSYIEIPEGEDWVCAECGETGNTHVLTLQEHYEKRHGGFPPDVFDT